MTKSEAGFILALIGGILGIISGIILAAGGGFMVTMYEAMGISAITGAVTALWIVLGILYIIFSVLMIFGGLWMRDKRTCKKGGLFALIFGILGGVNILAIIGGILGLVAAGK